MKKKIKIIGRASCIAFSPEEMEIYNLKVGDVIKITIKKNGKNGLWHSR